LLIETHRATLFLTPALPFLTWISYPILTDKGKVSALEAKLKGFEGDACPECGNFTMVRNGTCLKCTTYGGTTGCS